MSSRLWKVSPLQYGELQGLDRKDLALLDPFFNEVDVNNIEKLERLHVSGSGCTYLIRFHEYSQKWNGDIVLKAFCAKEKKNCAVEIQNLQRIATFLRYMPNSAVRVPEIVWTNPTYGLLATRWIPGKDFADILKASSRWWARRPPSYVIQDVLMLMAWLRRFAEIGLDEVNTINAHKRDHETWERWLSWLYDAKHLERSWRHKMVAELSMVRKWFNCDDIKPGLYHGDFTPWNIRRDDQGGLWVFDWALLEAGHWLEAAYRFDYALRISELSPLARSGYFGSICAALEKCIWEMEPDKSVHQYYRIRAIVRNLYYMCRRPASHIKQKIIQRYWKHELLQWTMYHPW